MIADKILPTFYIIDVEGEAAKLECLFGGDFNLKSVQFASVDFKTDIEAVSAAEDAMEFIIEAQQLKIDVVEKEFNPDFFPTMEPIEVPDEIKEQEEAVKAQATEMSERDETISAVIITKRFDALGDFIACKTALIGPNTAVYMKIGINPRDYVIEKQKEEQERIDRQYGKPSRNQLHVH